MNTDQHKKSTISFGIVADLQFCDMPPYINRYFKNSPEKLTKAIEEFNKHPLDFIINLGDLIGRDWASYDWILPLFQHADVPVHHVLGNHDYEVEEKYKAQVPNKLGTQKYYDFSISNWRFIVLDGTEISTFANLENSEEYQTAVNLLAEMAHKQKVNANFWNGAIGIAQLDWLHSTLAKATQNHEDVLIFCHYPIYPEHRHNLLNDHELVNTLEKYDCVKAWFSGHNHDGNYGFCNEVHFVNLKGMVDTEFESAFSIVDLSVDTITIKGFGREHSAQLIIKTSG